ncbi:conjugal transfer protein TrbE [uncultured Mitsuokella sp.]|uniref:TraG/VirB4 family ATPase n=1 Tax=uncultured Mitsuokella sp. TaxID=453120 RepID=UPI0026201AFC|nr:conjugal transfer protein TrbE [uncultured Mitsuokella sp.]
MYRKDWFARKRKPLRDIMVWGRITESRMPSTGDPAYIVLNKDGSMQVTFTYHGPDLDSSIQAELSAITVQIHTALAAMDSDWCLYFEAQRVPSTRYPTQNYFPDSITWAMDQERKALFSNGSHFESKFYATLYWMPPPDTREKVKEMLIEGREHKEVRAEDTISSFMEQVNKFYNTYTGLRIPIRLLTEDETLTYLHSIVSDRPRPLVMPKHPMLLDKYLYDTPFYGGLEPKLNHTHIRVVTPLKYMKMTEFGHLDVLNRLDFPYRWSTRCYTMSKQDTLSELEKIRRKWYAKLQSIWSYIIHNKEVDTERHNDKHITGLLDEIESARLAVEADSFGYVYYTTAVIIEDEDQEAADDKARIVYQVFTDNGFKAKIEDVNAVEGWLGSIPGLVGRNIRRELVSTANFVHLMPLSDIWAGNAWNKHLNGPPLLYTQTSGNTPFRLNLHVGQIGHTMLVGDTGAGKSVHLNCIDAAFRKYKNSRVIIFDNGKSSKVLTYGVGGKFYDLGEERGEALSFQPLANIDDARERQWAQEWLCDFLREENVEITPRLKGLIRDALGILADSPTHFRTITNFIDYLQDDTLKTAFAPLSQRDRSGNAGEYGNIFDSDHDTLKLSSWQTFEMGKIINQKSIIGPTLMFIFHRIENMLKGYDGHDVSKDGPTLIVLDECWMFFKNPLFANKIEDWLRTLRKFHASVIFATQSLDDVVHSPLFDIILGSCKTHIFLPDDLALEPKRRKIYEQFKLNERQMEILSMAKKQKHYYYTSSEGSRLYDLGLEECPITLAYVAVDKDGLNRCDQILAEYGAEHFNEHWLAEHNLTLPEEEAEMEALAI